MDRNERDDIKFRISRRRLLQTGAALSAVGIAGIAVSCLRPDSGSSPDLKIPILRSQEDENTDIAKKFIEAAFRVNTKKERPGGPFIDVRSFDEFKSLLHSGAQAEWRNTPGATDFVVEALNEWNFCKDVSLVNPRQTKRNDVTFVEFDFQRPCDGEIETTSYGTRAKQKVIRKSITVRLEFDPKTGKNAPVLNFTGKTEYIGTPQTY